MKETIGQFLGQLASLLTIHALPLAMVAPRLQGESGGPDRATGEPVELWLRSWVAPAVLLAIAMVVFQAGVYVGRDGLTTLALQIQNHEQGVHAGSMPRGELTAEIRVLRQEISSIRETIELRLTAIERRLD